MPIFTNKIYKARKLFKCLSTYPICGKWCAPTHELTNSLGITIFCTMQKLLSKFHHSRGILRSRVRGDIASQKFHLTIAWPLGVNSQLHTRLDSAFFVYLCAQKRDTYWYESIRVQTLDIIGTYAFSHRLHS